MPMVGPNVEEMERVATSDDNRAEVITFTAPFDYSGHPTLTLPHGLNDAGVPLSFQFIGPSLGEDKLLQIGAAYEAAVGQLPHPEI